MVALLEKEASEKSYTESELTKTEREINSLKEQTDKLNEQIELKEKKISQIEESDLSDYNTEIAGIEDQLSDTSKFYEKANKISDDIDKIRLIRLKKYDDTELKEARKTLTDLKLEWKEAVSKYEAVLDGKCPTCGAVYSSDDIESLKEEVDRCETEYEGQQKKVDALEQEEEEYEAKKEALQEKKEEKAKLKLSYDYEVENAEKQIEQLQNRKQQLQKDREKAEKEKHSRIDELREDIEYYRNSIHENENKIETLRIEYGKLEKKLEAYPERGEKDTYAEQLTQKEQLINKYVNTIQVNKDIEASNKKLERIEKADQVDLDTLKKQLRELQDQQELYAEAKDVLRKEFPSYVLSRMVETIEVGINKFIDKTYYKSLDVKIKETKNAINIVYGKKGLDIAHLSGAEESLVSLAYRNYLNKMMNLETILLDEPDAHLTEDNAIKFYTVIGEMQKEYKQVFVISHNEKAKERLLNHYGAKYFEIDNGKVVA